MTVIGFSMSLHAACKKPKASACVAAAAAGCSLAAAVMRRGALREQEQRSQSRRQRDSTDMQIDELEELLCAPGFLKASQIACPLKPPFLFL